MQNWVMLFDTWTRKAIGEVEALAERIVGDLDETVGGIGWWSGYALSEETRCGMSDYLIDAVRGVDRHLRMADFYVQEYEQKRKNADFKVRGRMRDNGGDPVARGADIPADEESRLRLQSYVYAFFNLGCSVLDTLAGTVIGIAALPLPLVKADLAKFTPFTRAPDYPFDHGRLGKSLHSNTEARDIQLRLIRSFRTSVMEAGPGGWHVWMDHKRNQLAHRGGRLQVMAYPRLGRGVVRDQFLLLERDPDKTTIQGFHGNSSTMESMYLLEDELTTMKGLLKSLNTTVIGTIVAARGVWEQRSERPQMLQQPATQWHQPNTSGFDGYGPIPELFKTVNAAIVNPTDATRLSSSHALSKRNRTS